jgi:hypothetical protein
VLASWVAHFEQVLAVLSKLAWLSSMLKKSGDPYIKTEKEREGQRRKEKDNEGKRRM